MLSAFGVYSFTDDQKYAIEALAAALFGLSHLPPDRVSLPTRNKDR